MSNENQDTAINGFTHHFMSYSPYIKLSKQKQKQKQIFNFKRRKLCGTKI